MIDLMKLPASEAERLAYAEGFTGTAELLARLSDAEHRASALEAGLEATADGQMTAEQLKAISTLRNAGYAVIIWTPEELAGVDPSDVEDASISYASEYLIPATEADE